MKRRSGTVHILVPINNCPGTFAVWRFGRPLLFASIEESTRTVKAVVGLTNDGVCTARNRRRIWSSDPQSPSLIIVLTKPQYLDNANLGAIFQT